MLQIIAVLFVLATAVPALAGDIISKSVYVDRCDASGCITVQVLRDDMRQVGGQQTTTLQVSAYDTAGNPVPYLPFSIVQVPNESFVVFDRGVATFRYQDINLTWTKTDDYKIFNDGTQIVIERNGTGSTFHRSTLIEKRQQAEANVEGTIGALGPLGWFQGADPGWIVWLTISTVERDTRNANR